MRPSGWRDPGNQNSIVSFLWRCKPILVMYMILITVSIPLRLRYDFANRHDRGSVTTKQESLKPSFPRLLLAGIQVS
jgi:hypothetical protein